MRSLGLRLLLTGLLFFQVSIQAIPSLSGMLAGMRGVFERNPIVTLGAASLAAAGLYYYYTKPGKPVKKKQVDKFYESQAQNAKLVTEPVEWPVKAVYADSAVGRIMGYFAGVFGGYVTHREGKLKQDKARTEQYLKHYLSFYKNEINMDEYEVPKEGFETFNDWFIRRLKNPAKDRPLENNPRAIASPADSKLIIIPDLSLDAEVTIKEQKFDIGRFLNNPQLAKQYEGGIMMIFRLSPYNYHRYHYPFDCFVGMEQFINGKYHSVNPRAFVQGVKPLTENKRSYQLLTPSNGKAPVAMVQVGATAVASIVNHFMDYSFTQPQQRPEFADGSMCLKGSETGYFQFGGSTVVLLFAKGSITPNERIVQNSLNGYETAVKVCETVAYWN